MQDPLAATIDAEVTADDAAESQQPQKDKESAASPLKPEDTVDTGNQHVIKVTTSSSWVLCIDLCACVNV